MKKKSGSNFTRREFFALSSALAATTAWGTPSQKQASASTRSTKRPSTSRPNILFVFTDQERYFNKRPSAFPMPGHSRLSRTGTSFNNHYVSATMCTSSRSVMMTGLQTIDTKMFDNTDTPYIQNLSTRVPTLGHMLRKAGYYTAYKGKWHLNREFEKASCPSGSLEATMNEYGFGDFTSPGDAGAHTLGGYHNDDLIGASAISWLRTKGKSLNEGHTPWCLTVSLVNPHDIMYFNADEPGTNIQDTGKLLMQAARAPETPWYKNDWQQALPAHLHQPMNQKGRPAAHGEYLKAWAYCLGQIPLENANWRRFTNFYLNSLRSVDYQLSSLLSELDSLNLSDNTIIVYTADHGEMGGNHGLRGKGPFAYEESIHVPFYIVHPDVKGGSNCMALTSHIDIVPSLLSFAGVKEADISEMAGRKLPGKDFSKLLTRPKSAGIHDLRDKVLFTYSGISTNDSEIIRIIAEAKANGQSPKDVLKQTQYKPDLSKRGSLRSVFDGRYKFTRYFAPIQRNSPKTREQVLAYNDVELYDLKTDSAEMVNLATDLDKNGTLLDQMNAKLEVAIAEEMGQDDGREMPNFPNVDWSIEKMDL